MQPVSAHNNAWNRAGLAITHLFTSPSSDEGHCDDIHRYQRIHAEFEVPEDVFKLIGKAAEPPVKPVVRDAPVDTTGVNR